MRTGAELAVFFRDVADTADRMQRHNLWAGHDLQSQVELTSADLREAADRLESYDFVPDLKIRAEAIRYALELNFERRNNRPKFFTQDDIVDAFRAGALSARRKIK